MRILYITNGFPFPLTSGYLRHYHLIRRLAERHEIELLSLVGGDFRPELEAGLEPYTTSIRTFQSSGRSRSRWRKAARRVRDWALAGGAERAARDLARAVDGIVRDRPPDVVLLSGKRTDPVLEHLDGVPLVVDMCDATSARVRGSLRYAPAWRRIPLRAELARVRRVEARLLRAGRYLLFASQRDEDLLVDGAPDAERCVVVPNGVDLEFWRRRSRQLGTDEVVFSGAMHYLPNEDAALFLVDAIMPRVWREEPSVRLRIVGRDPRPELERRGEDPRVAVTGFVEDVRPHLESAAVFAAPLRFAAGIQNKLLEAMAMELPVVASSVAAAGLRTAERDEPPIVVADDAEEVAAALVAAVRRARQDRSPDAAARRYVAEHFDWDRAVDDLERVLAALVPGD
jgi:polysaccharide biosynthesis protein PslH